MSCHLSLWHKTNKYYIRIDNKSGNVPLIKLPIGILLLIVIFIGLAGADVETYNSNQLSSGDDGHHHVRHSHNQHHGSRRSGPKMHHDKRSHSDFKKVLEAIHAFRPKNKTYHRHLAKLTNQTSIRAGESLVVQSNHHKSDHQRSDHYYNPKNEKIERTTSNINDGLVQKLTPVWTENQTEFPSVAAKTKHMSRVRGNMVGSEESDNYEDNDDYSSSKYLKEIESIRHQLELATATTTTIIPSSSSRSGDVTQDVGKTIDNRKSHHRARAKTDPPDNGFGEIKGKRFGGGGVESGEGPSSDHNNDHEYDNEEEDEEEKEEDDDNYFEPDYKDDDNLEALRDGTNLANKSLKMKYQATTTTTTTTTSTTTARTTRSFSPRSMAIVKLNSGEERSMSHSFLVRHPTDKVFRNNVKNFGKDHSNLRWNDFEVHRSRSRYSDDREELQADDNSSNSQHNKRNSHFYSNHQRSQQQQQQQQQMIASQQNINRSGLSMNVDNTSSEEYVPGSLTAHKFRTLGTPEAVRQSRYEFLKKQRQFKALALQHEHKINQEGQCRWPRPKVISVQRDPAKTYTPHCTILHRCGEDTGCCIDDQQICVAKYQREVDLYFVVSTVGNSRETYEKLTYINHTECECVDRQLYTSLISFNPPEPILSCDCPTLFVPKIGEEGTCQCDCDRHNPECHRFKRGEESFSIADRKCIIANRCKMPMCEYGTFTKINGRCPKLEEKIQSAAGI